MSKGAPPPNEEPPRPRLGRGLAALLAESASQPPEAAQAGHPRRLPTIALRPNPRNPRRHFAQDDIDDLAQSIGAKGVIQPIIVRPVPNDEDRFEIVAGERRWRAAQVARLQDVPVIVVEATDREALELAIIENVQRTDLNPLEEARGYERLARDYGYSQTDLARIIGKSRPHVANTLRLLKLPESIEVMLNSGELTAGHARALLAFDDPEPVARRVVAQGLNVRDVERLAQAGARPGPPPARAPGAEDVARRLSLALDLPVALHRRASGGAEVRIVCRTPEDLDRLSRRLTR